MEQWVHTFADCLQHGKNGRINFHKETNEEVRNIHKIWEQEAELVDDIVRIKEMYCFTEVYTQYNKTLFSPSSHYDGMIIAISYKRVLGSDHPHFLCSCSPITTVTSASNLLPTQRKHTRTQNIQLDAT